MVVVVVEHLEHLVEHLEHMMLIMLTCLLANQSIDGAHGGVIEMLLLLLFYGGRWQRNISVTPPCAPSVL